MGIAEQKTFFLSVPHWQKVMLKKFTQVSQKRNSTKIGITIINKISEMKITKTSTTLETYLWNIKSTPEEQNVNLTWKIMQQDAPY